MCELIKRLNNGSVLGLKVNDFLKGCSYHRKKYQNYSSQSLLFDFKCLELFHAIYPKYLAIVYNGKFKSEELTVRCPGYYNNVRLNVTIKRRDFLNTLINFIKRLLRPVLPSDIIDKILEFRVCHIDGNCPAGLHTGDNFTFPFKNTVCPAIIYSMLPMFGSYEKDISFSCPSHTIKVECKLIK